MCRFAKHFLVLLAVLAVGAAQVFGIARGFVCDCSGEPIHVESAVCDAACHPAGDHHDDGDEEPDHQHEHNEATESIKLVPLAPLTFDLPAAGTDVSEVLALGVRLSSEEAERRAELKPPDDTGGSPPASVLVAETVVMLV